MSNKIVVKSLANFKSPDVTKLQEVKIDDRTSIYIAIGADVEEAKKHFLAKRTELNLINFPNNKN